ncbi:MAG: molybdopterin cofactor-binding domain-containing protein [Gammaproteobacteria bacterium]
MKFNPRLSRRGFLKSAAALPAASAAAVVATQAQNADAKLITDETAEGFVSDFVRITPDDRIIVIVKHVEAGQGPATGLATLVAEEMNADWDKVETAFAPADNARYANLLFGIQGTGGSTAMANSFLQYRKAGAAALLQLKAAAAQQWKTAPENIRAENGILSFGGKRARYGEMASAAAQVTVPIAEPQLKPADSFVHIGKPSRPRKDIAAKLDGSAQYAMDFRPDNLLYAVVLRSPKFGGMLAGFDDSAARSVENYAGAKAVPGGVAVYGETLWAAIKARRVIKAEWDFSKAETRSSARMMQDYINALDKPGLDAAKNGDADGALANAHKTVAADFSFPFLAHAPMEPLNCVIQMRDGILTLWDGCQLPGVVQGAVGGVFGLPPEKVNIVSLLAGGTFGRRATPNVDYQTEAAHALKASPHPSRPLKVVWTREDDIRGGFYRPMFAHRVVAGINADGGIAGWRQRIAGKSILIGTPFEGAGVKDGVDNASVEGAADMPYHSANLHVDIRNMQTAVPVLWWRSVGHTHTAFAVETIMDMLAEAAGADAVAFRLRHLQSHPRHSAVLRAAADAAGWGKAQAGRFQGVAVHESFRSFVAEVVEISVSDGGAVKVEEVVCAVDCGIAVNPDIVRAQMESGVGYALGAAMRNQITLKEDGEVKESNFPDYQPLRINEMPKVRTIIIPSAEAPTGVGEPAVPPLVPALANAIYAATGKRITHQPFAAHGIKFA